MTDASSKTLEIERVYAQVRKFCNVLIRENNEQYRSLVQFQEALLSPSGCNDVLLMMSNLSNIEVHNLDNIHVCCNQLRQIMDQQRTLDIDDVQHKMETISAVTIDSANVKEIDRWPNFSSPAQELYKRAVGVVSKLLSINVSMTSILTENIDGLRLAKTFATVCQNTFDIEKEVCDGNSYMSEMFDEVNKITDALQCLIQENTNYILVSPSEIVKGNNNYASNDQKRDATLRVTPLTIGLPIVHSFDESSDGYDSTWSD